MQRLANLLGGFKSEAFRLELLDVYRVPGEWEIFTTWLKDGTLPPDPEFDAFLEGVRRDAQRGKKHVRVHVLDFPLTDYLRFEIETGYQPMSVAGADILLLTKQEYRQVIQALPSGPAIQDFWLFDNHDLVKLRYESDGTLVGEEPQEENEPLTIYQELRQRLLKVAVPMEKFLAEEGSRHNGP